MEEALEVLLAALGGLLVVTVAVDALTTTWRSARDLHYFHSAEPATSARLQLIILDEALTLLDGGVAPDTTRPQRLLNRTRQSLDGYCDVVAGYVPPAREASPPPPLDALWEAGLPTVDDSTYRKAMDALSERRRLLSGVLEHDAWSWAHVTEQ